MVEDNKQKECLKISTTTFRNIMNEFYEIIEKNKENHFEENKTTMYN